MNTLPALIRRNATEYGDKPALSYDGTTLTWAQTRSQVAVVAEGLRRLGVGKGDRVLVMMTNRPEHWITDQAVTHLGAIPCTVYSTTPAAQLEYLGRHSGAKVLVVEGAAQATPWIEVVDRVPDLEYLVMLADETEGGRFMPWAEVFAYEPDLERFEAEWDAVAPDDDAALIYTSGTTGAPKGVLITHDNVVANVDGLHRVSPIPEHFTNICYLPLAHIAERMVSIYMPIFRAAHVTFCPDQARLVPELQRLHPTLFFGVPRIWEKIGGYLRATPGSTLADMGLDRVEWACSAAAPLPAEIQKYFRSQGLTVLEGWGMTEATGIATTTRTGEFRVGSVGQATPGNETMLLDDGEVLIRGPIVAAGYLQEDGTSTPVTDDEGWLHTGDVGTVVDGHLFIIDRKKELIITSGGKNVAPVKIEALLTDHPLIGQALAYGDRRKYIVALLALDAEQAPAWAAKAGIEFTDLSDLSTDATVLAEVERVVAAANEKLSRPEQVKKFRVLAGEWTPESGELTPSMKMKRATVQKNYRDEIESMYT
ncbi:AMP-dependent synthetase/ligase [Tomitella fengzijianii]|uniref:AMP-dependent synthetase/ligase n=1 Tax=Tomitella fengzijianii TaxID=2597660 RepID=UPI00131D6749|nr:AMP-dependent synthetase/ligase [Tomitella fengzijianii]